MAISTQQEPVAEQESEAAERPSAEGGGLLTWFLAIALLVLNVQMLKDPKGLMLKAIELVDARNWSSTTWLVVSCLLVGGLMVVRFLPEMRAAWKRMHEKTSHKRKRYAWEQEQLSEREQKRKEHRRALEIREDRMRAGYRPRG